MSIFEVFRLGDRAQIISILEYILQKDRAWIFMNQEKVLKNEQESVLKRTLMRIEEGEPLQYILGKAYFMGLEFKVNENVLIPQPDTEILVEHALKELKENFRVLDLCTGSGCIAISLKKKFYSSELIASDISEKALEVAKENAESNEVKIEFIKSDLFNNIDGKFDIIVSNPPYIETDLIKTLSKEVQNEPILALDGGQDGLDFYKRIIKDSKKYLKDEGKLFLEVGYNQSNKVKKILQENNYANIEIIKDYGNNERVLRGKYNG